MVHLLTGEPLAIDLVNTRVATADGPADALATAEGLREWLGAEGDRLDVGGGIGAPALDAVRALRDDIERSIDAARRGAAPPRPALAAINAAARRAPQHTELAYRDGEPVARRHRAGTATDRLLAQLADAAIELLTDPRVTRIRDCEGPGCRMIFLPAHPNRRWCATELCGNRVRVARHYARQKQTGTTP